MKLGVVGCVGDGRGFERRGHADGELGLWGGCVSDLSHRTETL